MNTKIAVELLEMLLQAEIDAGRPPGAAPSGIYDGPKQINDLIRNLKIVLIGKEKTNNRSLIGSVYGGYLGRGALFWQQGLDKTLPHGFEKKLAAAMEYLIAEKV